VLSLQRFNMPVRHVISEDEATDILRHVRSSHGTAPQAVDPAVWTLSLGSKVLSQSYSLRY